MDKKKALHCKYAPIQQEMNKAAAPPAAAPAPWPSQDDITALKHTLDAREAELQSQHDRLQQQELALSAQLQLRAHAAPDGTSQPAAGAAAAAAGGAFDTTSATNTAYNSTPAAAQYLQMQQERSLLLTRWQCLLEDKKQLTSMLKLAAGGSTRKTLRDFEPGETPMRDVTCSVITHQLDTPCLSCCFQR